MNHELQHIAMQVQSNLCIMSSPLKYFTGMSVILPNKHVNHKVHKQFKL